MSVFTSFDGTELFYREWHGGGRAALLGVNGIGAFAENYAAMAEALNRAGVDVYAPELRGFGRWKYENKWGYSDFAAMAADVELFLRQVVRAEFDGPVFLAGESLGALICIKYLLDGYGGVDGLIVTSPFVAGRGMRLASLGLAPLRWLWPGFRVKVLGDMHDVTHDEEFIAFDAEMGIGAKWYTAEILYEAARFSGRIQRRLRRERLPVPVLCAGGGLDVLLTDRRIRGFYAAIQAPEKRLRIYPDGRHLLMNDVVKHRLFEDILRFIGDSMRS